MKKQQVIVSDLNKGFTANINSFNNNQNYQISNFCNFVVDGYGNVKKRIGTNFVTNFTSEQDILSIKFLKLYNYNVMLVFTPNKLTIIKEENGSYNASKTIKNFTTPYVTKKHVNSCAMLSYGNIIYILSLQGFYVIEDTNGNIAMKSFIFDDGPWHSPNEDRKKVLYVEGINGVTYVKSSNINIFKKYMQGYYMHIITNQSHCSFVEILEYISPSVLKVYSYNSFPYATTNRWCLGNFKTPESEDEIKPLKALVRNGRLYIAYSNPINGNVVVSVSFLNQFARYSISEKISEIATSPRTHIYDYTVKSGYYYQINQASEVSFLVESGSGILLGTNKGVFKLHIDDNIEDGKQRKTEFSKLNSVDTTGSENALGNKSVFVLNKKQTAIFKFKDGKEFANNILNTNFAFNYTSTLQNICQTQKPFNMVFSLQNNKNIICITENEKANYALQSFEFACGIKDSSYIKIHAIELNSFNNKLYMAIEREKGLLNIEALNINDFNNNCLPKSSFIDCMQKVNQQQDGTITNLNKFIGHRVNIIANNINLGDFFIKESELKLDKTYNSVAIGYAYNCFVDIDLKQTANKKRVNSLTINTANNQDVVFIATKPFVSYFSIKPNNCNYVFNNYLNQQTFRLIHTKPCSFNLKTIEYNLLLAGK